MNRVVVIGAGPAGLIAAACAAQGGHQVTLVDDNPEPGGQLWRGGGGGVARQKLEGVNVALLNGARVVAAHGNTLTVETRDRAIALHWDQLIVAAGARERFLPFPGWTLPGAMGAGAMQAFIKSGLDVRGKRIVVAGTGPILLAVAALAKDKGAEIAAICEQAPAWRVRRFAFHLSMAKILEAIHLKRKLRGVPLYYGTWVREAEGGERVRRVILSDGRAIDCDYAACGYGLVPNTELLRLLEGRENVHAVGECTGIGGYLKSAVEGAAAGYRVAGDDSQANKLRPVIEQARKFAVRLERTFAPRAELRSLPRDETVVCRCEGVAFGALRDLPNWRYAKLHTRCGMGPCQGRVCGPAVEFLFGWKPDSTRPPVLPARVDTLMGGSDA